VTSLSPAELHRAGEVVADKYQIVRLLGSGGMGAVYEAKHVFLGRRVALKFLHPRMAENAEIVARFQSEAKAAGGLESENLVAVTDFGVTDDHACFLVMEYLEGEDLAHLLERVGPLPVTRAVRIVIQACRGVAVAHRAEIIHRDLKPQNLFIGRRAEGTDLVKVLDFGIAKLRRAAEKADFATRINAPMGTPNYMAPEQARSAADVDERADIYALGVILYEALSRKLPHPGETYHQIIAHLLTEPPIRLDSVCPGIPTGLYEIVDRAIAANPQARFPSVDALATALQPYANTWAADSAFGATIASPPSASDEGRAGMKPSSGPPPDTGSNVPLSISRNGSTQEPSLFDTSSRIPLASRRWVAFAAVGVLLLGVVLFSFGRRESKNAAPASPTASMASAPAAIAPAASVVEAPKDEPAQPPVVPTASAMTTASAPAATTKPVRPAKPQPHAEPSASEPAPVAKPESGWRSVLVRDISFDGGSKASGQHGPAGEHP